MQLHIFKVVNLSLETFLSSVVNSSHYSVYVDIFFVPTLKKIIRLYDRLYEDIQNEDMSSGVNDGPRNTGTLPKSNRRSDRNRERSAANQQMANRSAYHRHVQQHSNNLPINILLSSGVILVLRIQYVESCYFSVVESSVLSCPRLLFQLDWQLVSERGPLRTTKNSNTRSVSSLPSTSYQEISEFVSHTSGRHCNYSTEDCTSWPKMVLPAESQTQSSSCLQGTKPSNVDKMPDRNQVESRLNQIRDYIGITSTMMDSLSQSSDPRAQNQNEKLSRMVEDLRDSETKLAKLLETYHNHGITNQVIATKL
ncbi:serine-rich adhesin for platelets isoform X1 [Vespula squamosa]|uniref:Serine-rich adhesin for platelets isoform X1 n=1 Tax=Vespula squamosa TaxID=30214 RepID=A0ABD2B2T7_VESSQ